MDVVYHFQSSIPYSLHDGRVNRMVWEDGDLRLFFEDGYLELSQPPRPVEGQVRIRQVDEDFSYVHFLSDYGRFGSFQGKKCFSQSLSAGIRSFLLRSWASITATRAWSMGAISHFPRGKVWWI